MMPGRCCRLGDRGDVGECDLVDSPAAFDDSISQIPLADLALFALYRQGWEVPERSRPLAGAVR